MKKELLLILFPLMPILSPAQIITTIAGTGINGYSGDGGPGTAAQIFAPWGIAVDGGGNVYFADHANSVIRKVTPLGIISTFAGNGMFGYGGDGGPATAAEICSPIGVAVDSSGNVYFGDQCNNRVRKVSTSGIISTFAGNGIAGYAGDGGAATVAELNGLWTLTVDRSGNVYIGDNGTRIRKVDQLGTISTFAGNDTVGYSGNGGPATTAEFDVIEGIHADADGNVYIADDDVGLIRKVNTLGVINNVVGNIPAWGFSGDGGPATAAELTEPLDVTIDRIGNMYICDAGNTRIRRVNTSGIISTFAGGHPPSLSMGDGGPATDAAFGEASSIATDNNGNVYVTDYSDNRIRKITLPVSLINGASVLCAGSTITLNNATTGGTWTSSNVSIATVGSATGIVTGISPGVDSVIYTVGVNTMARTVTINPLPPQVGIIAGPSNVCPGSMIILTDSIPGGIWSSDNTVATVIDGTVTGAKAGTDTIRYSLTNSCGTSAAIKTITIDPLPNAGAITGPANLCAGANMTLVDSTLDGTWSSINTDATVSAAGMVIAVTTGFDTIAYTIFNNCGSATATKIITIEPLPDPGIITGPTDLCVGDSVILADAQTGGIWSISNTFATISGSVIVTGQSSGTDILSYSVTNTCGSAVATQEITVNPLHGNAQIMQAGSLLSVDSSYLYYQWLLDGKPIPGATVNTYMSIATGTYSVIVTNSSGCSVVSPSIVISDCNISDILIYPNPAQSMVYIQWCKNVTAKLSCIDGKFVAIRKNATEIDLTDLPNATYTLTIFDQQNNKILTKLVTKLTK